MIHLLFLLFLAWYLRRLYNVNDLHVKLSSGTIPTKGTRDSLGYDLYLPDDVTIPPLAKGYKIPLGLSCEWIDGYLLAMRSSTVKTGIRMANSIGIIDQDYTGEISVLVDNVLDEKITLLAGQRYFQLIFPKFDTPRCARLDDSLAKTDRGVNGFGSTGY